tara:strand:+ start:1233 stop:1397 length:165 start_codon:yes stop_codon:yes gene_type:complete
MTNEIMAALIGVPMIFAFAFAWTWMEERSRAKAKRKYDQQMAKYDTWMDKLNRM